MKIQLFNIWYFVAIVLSVGVFLGLYFLLRKRTEKTKKIVLFSIFSIVSIFCGISIVSILLIVFIDSIVSVVSNDSTELITSIELISFACIEFCTD